MVDSDGNATIGINLNSTVVTTEVIPSPLSYAAALDLNSTVVTTEEEGLSVHALGIKI